MKELELKFTGRGEVKGFLFEQVYGAPVYVYRVSRGSREVFEYYEVFERRENTQFNTVSYPSSKSFGIWAYYCGSLGKAEAKRAEILKRLESR